MTTQHQYPRLVLWGQGQLTRPTTSFARGCKLWSSQRQYYEEERNSNMSQFSNRPYLSQDYPELEKHYPGTWRVATPRELDNIVLRLTRPTVAARARQDDIQTRSSLFRFLWNQDKAKDIVNRSRSAHPRLQGNSGDNCAPRPKELHAHEKDRKLVETTGIQDSRNTESPSLTLCEG